jgi:ATP-dependent RNA helicase DeaD
MVVLDEADEMLNMGFREDIETILKDISEERQTILFSATMSKEIMKITKGYQKKPELIKVVPKQLTVPSIEQYYFEVTKSKKLEVLSRLLDLYNPKLSLVFCNTKKKVDELVGQLQSRGYFADGLHGDMKQPLRTRVMNSFRNGSIDILVATDVAARGIDVDDIEAVFNYDVPQDEEYYVHRIGRTGRVGRSGRAFTFVVGRKEIYKLKDIKRYANTTIKRHQIPSISDIEEIKTNQFMEEIKTLIKDNDLSKYVKIVDRLMEDDLTSVDIAAALIKNSIEKEHKELWDDNDFEELVEESGMVRLFVNIGKKHKISAKDIVGAIAGETGIKGKVIGAIDIFDKFTFVEVPKENAKEVLKIMKNSQIKGKRINIEPAKTKK